VTMAGRCVWSGFLTMGGIEMRPMSEFVSHRERCSNCAGRGEIVALRRAGPYERYKVVRLTRLCCEGLGRVMKRPSISDVLQDGALPVARPVSRRLPEGT
jgi:hypothetical protein